MIYNTSPIDSQIQAEAQRIGQEEVRESQLDTLRDEFREQLLSRETFKAGGFVFSFDEVMSDLAGDSVFDLLISEMIGADTPEKDEAATIAFKAFINNKFNRVLENAVESEIESHDQ